jgi:FtsZ-interacting cell division protein YlmF
MARRAFRTDRFDLDLGLAPPVEGPGGCMLLQGFAAGPGVYVYVEADGSTRREYVPVATLWHADAVESLRRAPVTLQHPPVFVDDRNVREYGHGDVGDVERGPGDKVRVVDVAARTAELKAAFRDEADPIVELSPGYWVDVEETPGVTPDGEEYDAVQVGRIYNHLAVVTRARGGPEMRLRVDGISDSAVMKASIPIASSEESVMAVRSSRVPRQDVEPDPADPAVEDEGVEDPEGSAEEDAEGEDPKAKALDAFMEKLDKLAGYADMLDKVDAIMAKLDALTAAKSEDEDPEEDPKSEDEDPEEAREDSKRIDAQVTERVARRVRLLRAADRVRVDVKDDMTDVAVAKAVADKAAISVAHCRTDAEIFAVVDALANLDLRAPPDLDTDPESGESVGKIPTPYGPRPRS